MTAILRPPNKLGWQTEDAVSSTVDHTGLLNLNSASYTHLTAANHTDLTDAGATTLHKHDHGGMDGLADNDHTQYLLRTDIRNSIAQVYLASADQTGIVHNTATKVNLNGEIYDIGSNFASYKYVAPATGFYQVNAGVRGYDAAGALTLLIAILYIDGADVRQGTWTYNSGATHIKSTVAAQLYMTASQYLELYGYGLTSDTNTFDFKYGATNTWLDVALISL